MAKGHAFQAPTGTRDFYPQDMLRRRYIEKMWRDTSIRHGFEEIDGPTFEHLDLYTVKSGEGIVNELFSFKRAGGEKDYALRPEFTPTLARMYAARAGGLAKPTKWFTAGPFFRAERPQRGRLREFLQWNCDIVGDESAAAEVGVVAVITDVLRVAGLEPEAIHVRASDRHTTSAALRKAGVAESAVIAGLQFLDRRAKLSSEQVTAQCAALELDLAKLEGRIFADIDGAFNAGGVEGADNETYWAKQLPGLANDRWPESLRGLPLERLVAFDEMAKAQGIGDWVIIDLSVARGLAYYTGMVFEVIAGGERAVAGGGRYDNLIELFGGPPTPAVGFGMGDVVLGNLLNDKGLMPEGRDLMDALAAAPASPRPDVFVIPNDREESQAAVMPLVASLRCGRESGSWKSREGRRPWDTDRYVLPPLHARHSYKATKNIGKLLQEASACHSRFAAIIESGSEATLKNLGTGEQAQNVPLADIAARVSSPH